jgi:hypothetical protein
MEQRLAPPQVVDVISTKRNWYVDGAIMENIATDEEALALMLFLCFWGGNNAPGLCQCPDCNPNCKTFLEGPSGLPS